MFVKGLDIGFEHDEPSGHGIGSSLHVKQTGFSKNLCLETDLALARQEQIVKMEVANIQADDDALNVHKTIQDMHMFAKTVDT